jgi:glycopeptide antibiotics resistance protein
MNIDQLLANYRGTGPFLLAALGIAALVTPLAAWVRCRRARVPYRDAVWRTSLEIVTGWSILAIVLVSLRPGETEHPGPSTLSLVPFEEIAELAGRDGAVSLVLGNLWLYAPAAFFLQLRVPRLSSAWIVAGGTGLSMTMEILQLLFVTDRSASVDDVLLNAAGAALGAGVARLLRALARAARRSPA